MDNRLENLRWATKKEEGRNKANCKAVHKLDLGGNILKTYGTFVEAAEDNGLTPFQVTHAARLRRGAGGFNWQLAKLS